jgi:hypothetical protein
LQPETEAQGPFKSSDRRRDDDQNSVGDTLLLSIIFDLREEAQMASDSIYAVAEYVSNEVDESNMQTKISCIKNPSMMRNYG